MKGSSTICSSPDQEDEAMEWITDWEYERIPTNPVVSSSAAEILKTSSHQENEDDDVSMDLEDDDHHAPIPLLPDDASANANSGGQEPSQEIAIFWTRTSEEFTEEDVQSMLAGIQGIKTSSSRNSLFLEDVVLEDHPLDCSNSNFALGAMASTTEVNKDSSDVVDEDDDFIMGPMQDKEGLLPPMKEEHDDGNAGYGMIESPKAFPSGSMGTHTTVDLMTDNESDYEDDDGIYDRRQQLLQQVTQYSPSSFSSKSKQDRRRSGGSSSTSSAPTKDSQTSDNSGEVDDSTKDIIFQRQQEIFNQMRQQEQQEAAAVTSGHHPYHPHQSRHRDCLGHFEHTRSPHNYQSYSPISVTHTFKSSFIVSSSACSSPNSSEYQKRVAQLTEKNLIERQRIMLQESMKRSLESRQALHIKPTALPDYNHDKLTRVLADIESSSRNISATYGRR